MTDSSSTTCCVTSPKRNARPTKSPASCGHADLEPDALKAELSALAAELRNERTAKNHDAVLNWTLRWAQMRKFVAVGRPHVITMQEVDCMAQLQAELAELGYSCGKPGMRYAPAHANASATWSGELGRGEVNKDAQAYLRHLRAH